MRLFVTFILNAITFAVYSQHAENIDITSNSFENEYRISNPTLNYSYDEIAEFNR